MPWLSQTRHPSSPKRGYDGQAVQHGTNRRLRAKTSVQRIRRTSVLIAMQVLARGCQITCAGSVAAVTRNPPRLYPLTRVRDFKLMIRRPGSDVGEESATDFAACLPRQVSQQTLPCQEQNETAVTRPSGKNKRAVKTPSSSLAYDILSWPYLLVYYSD